MRGAGVPLGLAVLVAAWTVATSCRAARHAPLPPAPVWIQTQAFDTDATFTREGMSLSLSLRPDSPEDGGATPVLRVEAKGMAPFTLVGATDEPVPKVGIGLVWLDREARRPDILFVSDTYGAHCCVEVAIGAPYRGRWRLYRMEFDGDPGPQFIRRLEGRGRYDIAIHDQSFQYAFGSHADSYAPLRIYRIDRGRLYDVTGERRFRRVHEEDMQAARRNCLSTNDEERNGGCAAYVAEAALTPVYGRAWRELQEHYDPSGSWGPVGCRKPDYMDCAAKDRIEFKSWRQALKWFLWRQGYDPAAPDFPCGAQDCAFTPDPYLERRPGLAQPPSLTPPPLSAPARAGSAPQRRGAGPGSPIRP